MNVDDLTDKSDEALMAMFKEIGHEPIDWAPVLIAELSRRNLARLNEATESLVISSVRVEKLTRVLIALTVALALLAVPPALDVLHSMVVSSRESIPSPRQVAHRSDTTKPIFKRGTEPEASADTSKLTAEELYFLLGLDENNDTLPPVDQVKASKRQRYLRSELPPRTSVKSARPFVRMANNGRLQDYYRTVA